MTNLSLSWCKEADRGLPRPDLVAYLKVTEDSQSSRSDWGKERFEKTEVQRKVAENYEQLKDSTWTTLNADMKIEEVHQQLLEDVLQIIEKVKSRPIEKLYDSQ